MEPPTRIESDIQLLVEGNDQRNFFEAFSDYLSLPGVQIHNFGGVSELRGYLAAFVKAPGFRGIVRSIGIVRDAETSGASAFESVCSSLRNAGLSAPQNPEDRIGDSPAVSALILPGRGQPGMLETLLCETLEGHPVDDCIDAFFECVEALPDMVTPTDKARARAYLTTRPKPHLSVGVAAKSGYWDLNHSAFSHVRDFLQRL